MAWFYNLIWAHFFRIGPRAPVRRLYGPAATKVRKFAFFPENSQIAKIHALIRHQKNTFFDGLLFQSNFFELSCAQRTIWPVVALLGLRLGQFCADAMPSAFILR
jgi:hypothetical protein